MSLPVTIVTWSDYRQSGL